MVSSDVARTYTRSLVHTVVSPKARTDRGRSRTVTVTRWVSIHSPDFPMTVKVVVLEGVHCGELLTESLSPTDGVHTYCVAPLARRRTVPPAQKAVSLLTVMRSFV